MNSLPELGLKLHSGSETAALSRYARLERYTGLDSLICRISGDYCWRHGVGQEMKSQETNWAMGWDFGSKSSTQSFRAMKM